MSLPRKEFAPNSLGNVAQHFHGKNDMVEIAREDDVVIPDTVAPHHDFTVTHRIPSIVQDNGNENEFTNEDLIALSRRRHESGHKLKRVHIPLIVPM